MKKQVRKWTTPFSALGENNKEPISGRMFSNTVCDFLKNVNNNKKKIPCTY